ncbi:hypothetical protein IE81DRAFT_324419 [Ceraceosorus guamensis]|uniref:BTB domain-containing protein n=1 Tax=Ceraceosorus guamensis TaxID=1522189 RepID=A0A316VVT8_9BASI|nr:hypothetical protein IE81DRAFT_324419 [Ceraceosorus guamensis]PWN41562.1 hypothetical protein IE81DRAFT_324419 [Ceraceosorus guamensis]
MAPTLLDCWACRDLQRFRAVLKGTQLPSGKGDGPSPSPRSPAHRSFSTSVGTAAGVPCPPSEVNRRDHLGRTVLHFIASCTEPWGQDWLVAVLAHPGLNVNAADGENGWTPLHRALYHGNILTAQLLLRRGAGSGAADGRLKDYEGLTPFDLYNSTVTGSAPSPGEAGGKAVGPAARIPPGELYAWGANRNYSLGHGDGSDRALPERVRVLRPEDAERAAVEPGHYFNRIGIKDIVMNKYTTYVLTDETSSNVRCAGVGGNGRLGRSSSTQTKLETLKDFHERAVAISVGDDHTCIVTETGHLYTFGHNKFQQLGFVIEHGQGTVGSTQVPRSVSGTSVATFGGITSGPPIPASSLDVQISPRRVVGTLKKEEVLGVAAGKLHTAAFTADALYTWGTNTGQLGYDRNASAVQVTPRKVTAITAAQKIRNLAVSSFATACLLHSGDVLILHNDSHFVLRFPQPGFSSDMSVFRPRQARPKPLIKRLVSGPNNQFAAISDMGDVFTFSFGHPSEYGSGSITSGNVASAKQLGVKPQLIWSVRKNKKIGAAEDVSLGQGSDLILTTESGHVFVRSRPSDVQGSGSGSAKGKAGWRPIPFLQRVIKVAMNESGGYAAIKAEVQLREIKPRGRSLPDDLLDLLLHLKAPSQHGQGYDAMRDITAEVTQFGLLSGEDEGGVSDEEYDSDSDVTGTATENAVKTAKLIGEAVRRWNIDGESNPRLGAFSLATPPFGVDLFVIAGKQYIPAHRAMVASRVPLLSAAFERRCSNEHTNLPRAVRVRTPSIGVATLELPDCSFPTALFLLQYLYSDELPAVWTTSIGMQIDKHYSAAGIDRARVRSELQGLADLLQLPALKPVIVSPVPRLPTPTLRRDCAALFRNGVDVEPSQSAFHDVELQVKDRVVPAHSVLLRRSPFFAALFQPDWTCARWRDGKIVVDMSHMRWDVFRILIEHIYTDRTTELFAGTDQDLKLDSWIDFITEVLGAANEMLLDRLKLVCCALLRRLVLPNNVASLLSSAEFYHAIPLKDALMDYMARTMETLLERAMLEELEPRLVRDLTVFVRQRQDDRMHRSQASDYVTALVVKHQEYFDSLDLPPPSLHLLSQRIGKRAPRSPTHRPVSVHEDVTPSRASTKPRGSRSPAVSPELKPVVSSLTPASSSNANDSGFMFSMDDDDGSMAQDLQQASPSLAAVATRALKTTPSDFSLGSSRGSPSLGAWKAPTVQAEKGKMASQADEEASTFTKQTGINLRNIMAAEQARRPSGTASILNSASTSALPSGSSTPVRTSSSSNVAGIESGVSGLTISGKLSQRDRRKQSIQQQQPAAASSPTPAPATPNRPAGNPWANSTASISTSSDRWSSGTPGSASPWRTPASDQVVTPLSLGPSSQGEGGLGAPGRPPFVPRASSGLQQSLSQTSSSSLGPTFTPQKGVAKAAQRRGAGGDSPWGGSHANAGDLFATSPPASSSSLALDSRTPPSTSGPQSFAAIQEEERSRAEQAVAATETMKRTTFAELIEQDRLDNEKRSKEDRDREAFEAWFESESRKVQSQMPNPNEGGKRSNKPSGNRGRGRGKGGSSRNDAQKPAKAEGGASHKEAGSSAGTTHKPKGRRGGAKAQGETLRAAQATDQATDAPSVPVAEAND